MGDLVGAIISVAVSIAFSVLVAAGIFCQVGFKLIAAIDDFQNAVKEKTQFKNHEEIPSTQVDKQNKI